MVSVLTALLNLMTKNDKIFCNNTTLSNIESRKSRLTMQSCNEDEVLNKLLELDYLIFCFSESCNSNITASDKSNPNIKINVENFLTLQQ